MSHDTIESLVTKLASTHGAKVDYALLRLPSGTVVELQPGVAIAEEARAELNEIVCDSYGYRGPGGDCKLAAIERHNELARRTQRCTECA